MARARPLGVLCAFTIFSLHMYVREISFYYIYIWSEFFFILYYKFIKAIEISFIWNLDIM